MINNKLLSRRIYKGRFLVLDNPRNRSKLISIMYKLKLDLERNEDTKLTLACPFSREFNSKAKYKTCEKYCLSIFPEVKIESKNYTILSCPCNNASLSKKFLYKVLSECLFPTIDIYLLYIEELKERKMKDFIDAWFKYTPKEFLRWLIKNRD